MREKNSHIHAVPLAPSAPGKKRARESSVPHGENETQPIGAVETRPEGMRLEPHICRACHSRLCSTPIAGTHERRYQCTNCGAEAHGHSAAVLCCCGTKLRRSGKSGRTGLAEVDAGIRCIANPAPTPEFPSLFVATSVR